LPRRNGSGKSGPDVGGHLTEVGGRTLDPL
jgi:hypothetical protein